MSTFKVDCDGHVKYFDIEIRPLFHMNWTANYMLAFLMNSFPD